MENYIVSGTKFDNSVIIWRTSDGTELWRQYAAQEIIKYKNDRIPLARKVWAGDHGEYIDFNADGSFLVSAYQNGLIKLWAWMGEDPALNEKRHSQVKKIQQAYNGKENN